MTPAARIQAAIEILDLWQADTAPLDRLLAQWGRQNRYAGSGDRAAIADHLYAALRRYRSAAYLAHADVRADTSDGRAVMLGLMRLQGQNLADCFTGARHAPSPPTDVERRPPPDLGQTPRAVRLDYPDWMEPHFADTPDEVLEALRHRAPVDLRVNTLRAGIDEAIAELARDGIEVEAGPLAPTCLRVTGGARKVQRSDAYVRGMVEIQDAASQAIAAMAGAAPGETVLDLCAGGGGKTLALAAHMQNRGRLIAHDISARRLAELPARAKRAGATIETIRPGETSELTGKCDLVVIDAPCSGSGAWRRNPDAKWRLTADRLAELTGVQSDLLRQGARLAAPGGRVLYATCSLLHCENAAIVEAFLAENPDWKRSSLRSLTPLDGGDGFFGAVLTVSRDRP